MPLLLSSVRAARFAKYFLPVFLWMFLIFGGSTNLGAPRNTSRILVPLLRWLHPGITDETIGRIQFVIRKSAHATEYGILCLLVWRALRNRTAAPASGWNWRDARYAILISALYAATDEFHQSFVASREGSPWDVLLDTCGATLAIFLFWRIGRKYKHW
ncbi:MAG: VanZ family protein [Verrucomicrobiota bacterium]